MYSCDELTLRQLLTDPLVRRLMRSDGVDADQLEIDLLAIRRGLSGGAEVREPPSCCRTKPALVS